MARHAQARCVTDARLAVAIQACASDTRTVVRQRLVQHGLGRRGLDQHREEPAERELDARLRAGTSVELRDLGRAQVQELAALRGKSAALEQEREKNASLRALNVQMMQHVRDAKATVSETRARTVRLQHERDTLESKLNALAELPAPEARDTVLKAQRDAAYSRMETLECEYRAKDERNTAQLVHVCHRLERAQEKIDPLEASVTRTTVALGDVLTRPIDARGRRTLKVLHGELQGALLKYNRAT